MTNRNAASRRSADGSSEMTSAMAAFTPFGATAWVQMMTESGRFITKRLEEDLKAQQALLASRTPEEVLQVQADYFRTAIEQYSAETNRVIGIMFGAMGGLFLKSGSVFARRYDDVPL